MGDDFMTDDPSKGPLTDAEMRRLAQAKGEAPGSALASWSVLTTDIPDKGLERERRATDAERDQLIAALGLASLPLLEVRYRVRALAGGGYRLSGDLAADVVQSCVVTLEPVPSRIAETIDVEFWRELDEPAGGEDKSVLEGADVEPLKGDTIPIGRIVFEAFSGALDPYPRKEGAAFDWQDKTAVDSQKSNPFSVLAKLKREE